MTYGQSEPNCRKASLFKNCSKSVYLWVPLVLVRENIKQGPGLQLCYVAQLTILTEKLFAILSYKITSFQNGFIITWILHKFIMFSNKVELEAGQNDTLNPPPYPIPSLPPYLMTSHNFSNVGQMVLYLIKTINPYGKLNLA